MRTVWIATALLAAMAVGAAQQDAKALLKQVQQKYRNAKSWDMQVDMTIETQVGTNSTKQQITSAMAIQRPNKVAARLSSGGVPRREVYSDGKTVYLYAPVEKQYQKMPMPANTNISTAQYLGEVGLLLQFLDEDLDKIGSNTQFRLAGTQTVAGKSTQVVEVRRPVPNGNSVTRVFVGTQDRLVYRVEYSESRRVQTGQGGGQNAQAIQFDTKVTAVLKYNSFDKPIPAARFRFKPPKDAKEVQPPQMGAPMTPPQGGGRGR